jgi:hypothetical protein
MVTRGNIFMASMLAMAAVGALAVLALSGCSGGPPSSLWTYTNPALKFALNEPPGWTLRETTGSVTVMMTGPAALGGGRPTANVVVEPTIETLDAYVERNVQTMQEAYKIRGFKVISRESRLVHDARPEREARGIVLTLEESVLGDEAAPRTVRQRQLYAVVGGRAYTLTVTATPDTFAECEPAFTALFGSFTVGYGE